MKHSIDSVREFHRVFGHPIAKDVNVATEAQRRLRVKLIAEELGELAVALGVPLKLEVKPDETGAFLAITNLEVAPEGSCACDENVDLIEAADALGDLDYVVQGSNLVFGFPSGMVLKEIHESNMSKLGADGKPIWNADGKVVKGPNYRKPNIMRILDTFDRNREL